jgi:TolB-like protein/Tfp pilus assembly protein PilF
MSFIEELKRRNVFRVAIAYLVSAWVMLQLADIVLESIEAPHWVIQAFMLALGLGFPIALIFAWAFEMTPEGIKKEKDVDRTQSITHKTGQKLNRSIIAVLVIAVALLLFDRFMPGSNTIEVSGPEQSVAAAPEDTHKSIAVLPFVNMSSDAEQEYFSDGISEEILNSLARVKNLKVAGRTSSFAFKGQNQDLRAIGETLGVGHILEGSVRKSGATVRITAQLIQVEDGFHLWSDTYDRELTDVFAIQDEIATAILEQLKAHLLEDGAEVVVAATRTNSEAYDLYLLAKQRIYERMQKPLESARDMLDRAIELDPEYAPAYAQRGIATMLLSQDSYGDIPDAQAQGQAKLFLDQALRLDPELAEAWAGLGLYHGGRPAERNLEIEALEKALSLNPNLVDAGNWLSNAYVSTNRPADALVVLEDVMHRDPLYRPGFGNLTFLYGQMGQLDKAVALLEQTRPFLPTDPIILLAESFIGIRKGQAANGLNLASAAREVQPNDRVFHVAYSIGLSDTSQNERLVEEGYRGFKVQGLSRLGRSEEAFILAREYAAEGDLETLFSFLNQNDRSGELIAYVEDRWPDLQQFEEGFPSNGYRGYPEMLEIALAYRRAGQQERFKDAVNRVRRAHDSLIEQGLANGRFWLFEAYYYALIDDAEKTFELLAAAIDEGLIASVRISDDFPVFRELEGDPEYEAIQARMVEHLNTERASLGLDPITT